MTSEIRANTLKNRVGLGTVSFTNTGAIVSGIVTANSFSGPTSGTTGTFSGNVDIGGDLDVDGHTNLDNVIVAGVSTHNDHIHLIDNKRLRLGTAANGDAVLLHNGSDTVLDNQTGNLFFRSASTHLQSLSGDDKIVAEANGVVELYHSGSKKLETKSTGVLISNQGNNRILDVHHTNGTSAYVAFLDQNTTDNAAVRVGAEGNDFKIFAGSYERLRIDSSGRLLVGTNTNNAHANADNAVISGTGNIGLSIMSTDSGRSSIYFGDSSSSPGSYAGFIDFVHSSNSFNIGRGNDNSLTIDSSGRLGLNQSTPASRLHISEAGSNTITIQLTNATTGHTAGTDGMTMGYSTNSTAGFINVCESGSHFTIKTGGTGSANERLRITSDGRLLIGETSVAGSAKLVVGNGGAENFEFTSGNSTYNGGLIEYIHRGDGNSRPDMNMYVAGPGAFKVYTNGANERVRITSNGDFKLSASTALSSPNTGYKRIVIGNNLILNAGSSAGGYTGFQNNAYVNSSGNWVRVNNDYASSIGMDDGNIYFRNVGAGTGNISWSMPLQIYANGTSTFGSTVTVNGHILSQGTSGRGGIFGQIQVGYSTLYNSIQNSVANTPIHLQYNNTGDIKCNEGGGDLRTNDVIPHTNNSANLGSNTRRWANVHTNDLNLSNEGNSNEIDGTWGQYTIQEGESDLFLINRRSGKRYKFLLQEV